MTDPTIDAPTPDWRGRLALAWGRARAHMGRLNDRLPDGAPRLALKIVLWVLAILVGLVLALVVFLWLFDWNQARGPIARYASARLQRPVAIEGNLRVHPWSLTPSATVDGLRIGNPAWAGPGHTAQVKRLSLKVKLIPLIYGQVELPLLRLDAPDVVLLRDRQGRATWDFSTGEKRKTPTRLPPIQTFIIENGRLQVTDHKRGLVFSGTVAASEERGARRQGFRMVGQGALNRAPFFLRVTGGPLVNVRRDRPYPFDADVRAGATRIAAKGAAPRPFDLGRFWADLDLSGQDLSDLYELTGVALPNTPPYRIRGRLTRELLVYRFDDFSGRVGDSDLSGDLSVDTEPERPFLKADIASRRLDFDDLMAVFGGAPAAGRGETLSAEQQVIARQQAATGRLLPDATLNVEKIRAMDADVRYRAATIEAPRLPLRSATAHIRLDNGLLTADPLNMTLTQGALAGAVSLNARQATPVTSLDLRLSNSRLEQFIPVRGPGGPALTGGLVARAKLSGAGESVHRAAADADGEVTFVATQGDVRQAFAELLGVNVVKGLGLLLSDSEERTPIRCGVARFRTTDGVMRADDIVVDTGVVRIVGEGTINLETERLNLELRGKPKKLRLIRLRAPITVKGPLRAPQVGVEAGG
ncbi:MAG: AsmA family protein, partial [Caulobacteraceae bacterium]|nr:AsmA family protein [Caulobacteraceae bacterium]